MKNGLTISTNCRKVWFLIAASWYISLDYFYLHRLEQDQYSAHFSFAHWLKLIELSMSLKYQSIFGNAVVVQSNCCHICRMFKWCASLPNGLLIFHFKSNLPNLFKYLVQLDVLNPASLPVLETQNSPVVPYHEAIFELFTVVC